jgi:hemerythrin-like domain-containing protein
MIRRSRELKPLSSEHQQALLVAFQLKQGIAGHAESAGAPRDLAGLLGLARRFHERVLTSHIRAEEELLGSCMAQDDLRRMSSEHLQLGRLIESIRRESGETRAALLAYADLLDRHVRWEDREIFDKCESALDHDALAIVGQELERRLVLARTDARASRR